MADAAAVAIPAPPPPPGWPSIAAALVPSRGAFAAAAVAGIIFLVLAMGWVLFASLGAGRVGRAACAAKTCPAVAAADGVSTFAMVSLGALGAAALVAAVCCIFISGKAEEEEENVRSYCSQYAPNDFIPPADEPVLCVLLLGMLALVAFVFVTVIGFVLKALSPFKRSQTERFGAFVIDVAVLCIAVLNCVLVLPAMALFAWKRMLVIGQRI
ncbi:unnamed protein product [Urochloa decumbens]|uniref:Uncharacterized protein n=1 Tax=Urochloa decumbens TaxID=240449 RepID=A0ABC9BE17_9POAL